MMPSQNQSKKNDEYSMQLAASTTGGAADKKSWQGRNKIANTAKPC